MGRPREHDERTAAALLRAAEHLVERDGPEALSVRGLAREVETTTRAIYTLFGSRDGLIAALGAQAFEYLRIGLLSREPLDDPVADLVETGLVFRRLAIERPALYSIGVKRELAHLPSWHVVRDAADAAWDVLLDRFAPIEDAGLLGEHTVQEAALQFHAMCEGLVALERLGTRDLSNGERIWRMALRSLIAGLAVTSPPAASPS